MELHRYQKLFETCPPPGHVSGVVSDQSEAEASWLAGELCCSLGGRVLDVLCGSGRLTVELARRGWQMTGMDVLEGDIREAGLRAGPAGKCIEWLCIDWRTMSWAGEFDAAICFGPRLGRFEVSELQIFLAGVARALKRGARFILQTGMAAESILPGLRDRNWFPFDNGLLAVANEYCPESSRLETACTLVREGRFERRRASHAVYTVAEIQRLIVAAGFRVLALYGSLRREPFKVGDPLAYFVAEKLS